MTANPTFLTDIHLQLEIQSRESENEPEGGHPDPLIRSFYRTALRLVKSGQFPSFDLLLREVLAHRPGINSTHFVNLWFRSVQYYFREHQDISYLKFTDRKWQNFFTTRHNDIYLDLAETIIRNNTATHIPQRYRSLRAAMSYISQNNIDLRVGDIGCSLGLGLKACFSPHFLLNPKFADLTPQQKITGLLAKDINTFSRAVAIDIRLPNIDWVKACNYPSRYDADGALIDRAVSELTPYDSKIKTYEADIVEPSTISILTANQKPLNLIYSSLSLYELDSLERQKALENITAALEENGFFVEFTFIDPLNWFNGVHTLVSQKKNGTLTVPRQWLVWKDSRCSQVSPGEDYEEVNQLFSSTRQYSPYLERLKIASKSKLNPKVIFLDTVQGVSQAGDAIAAGHPVVTDYGTTFGTAFRIDLREEIAKSRLESQPLVPVSLVTFKNTTYRWFDVDMIHPLLTQKIFDHKLDVLESLCFIRFPATVECREFVGSFCISPPALVQTFMVPDSDPLLSYLEKEKHISYYAVRSSNITGKPEETHAPGALDYASEIAAPVFAVRNLETFKRHEQDLLLHSQQIIDGQSRQRIGSQPIIQLPDKDSPPNIVVVRSGNTDPDTLRRLLKDILTDGIGFELREEKAVNFRHMYTVPPSITDPAAIRLDLLKHSNAI